jgi:hypothetical protein
MLFFATNDKMSTFHSGPQLKWNVGRLASTTGQAEARHRITFRRDAKDQSKHGPRVFVPPRAVQRTKPAGPPPGAQYFVPETKRLFTGRSQQRDQVGTAGLGSGKSTAGAVYQSYSDIEYYPAAIPRRPWAFRGPRKQDRNLNAGYDYATQRDRLRYQNTKGGLGGLLPNRIR